ncbi:MAG: TAXI family TRAP transporter solute-binding subunit [Geminicoccaceae bacterium]
MKLSNMALGACFALGLTGLPGATGTMYAQAETLSETRQKVNQNVVGIMAGSLGGSDLSLAADMGLALSNGYDLRVVPMVGLGSVKDVEDLLFLRGIDMAIVQQDVIDFMASNEIFPNIKSAVRLMAPLNVDQFHVLASKDFRSIYDLAGQQVNYGPTDGGTFMTSSVVFDTLGIDVEVTTYPHQVALDKLRNGEIAAMMRASGKPVSVIEEVKPGEPMHLLSVPADSLRGIYTPTALSSADYPALIDPSLPVNTVAVANALISYNWPKGHPRGESLKRFANALFANYSNFLEGGYHESWGEIDLGLNIAGVPRHWSSEEALSNLTQ